MRIISDFKDYYDFIAQYGFDPKIVYVRKTKEIKQERSADRYYSGVLGDFYWSVVRVHFCGVIYPIVKCRLIISRTHSGRIKESKDNFFHDPDKLESYLDSLEGKVKRELEKKYKYWGAKTNKDYIISHLVPTQNQTSICVKDKSQDYIKYNCPYFIYKTDGLNIYIIINPRLESLGFHKVMLPQQVYSSIEMFFSNVIRCNEPYVPDISDVDMRDIKGFDNWSFKKIGKRGRC